MRSIITGVSGFLGTRLQARLQELGHEVVSLSREHLDTQEPLEADYIFHLAAYGNDTKNQTDVGEIYNANVTKLLNLLQSTRNCNYKAFINIGTSSEYGVKNKPIKETMALKPDTYYAASKAAGTMLARVWALENNKPIVTMRPFSLYGEGEQDRKFIPILARAIFSGKKIKVAPGVHDWIHVDDFIDAMILVAQKASGLKGQVVNVGTGVQYTNEEVADLVEKGAGASLNREHVTRKLRGFDTDKMWMADNGKMRSMGWLPEISLEEGIKRYLDWYVPAGV